MKKTILLLLICVPAVFLLAGCSDDSLSIELPHGYRLRSDEQGTYLTGQAVTRYPSSGEIIGFMVNQEYFYGWNTPDCRFFIFNLSTGAISTFDSFHPYSEALLKLDITAPDMSRELTVAAILSKGVEEADKQLRTTGMKIERTGFRKYKIEQVD